MGIVEGYKASGDMFKMGSVKFQNGNILGGMYDYLMGGLGAIGNTVTGGLANDLGETLAKNKTLDNFVSPGYVATSSPTGDFSNSLAKNAVSKSVNNASSKNQILNNGVANGIFSMMNNGTAKDSSVGRERESHMHLEREEENQAIRFAQMMASESFVDYTHTLNLNDFEACCRLKKRASAVMNSLTNEEFNEFINSSSFTNMYPKAAEYVKSDEYQATLRTYDYTSRYGTAEAAQRAQDAIKNAVLGQMNHDIAAYSVHKFYESASVMSHSAIDTYIESVDKNTDAEIAAEKTRIADTVSVSNPFGVKVSDAPMNNSDISNTDSNNTGSNNTDSNNTGSKRGSEFDGIVNKDPEIKSVDLNF